MTAADVRITGTSHRRSERSRRITEKLERELGAVVFGCLRDPQVVDIILNPDGGIWVERLGGAPERLGEMPSHQAEALIATVAAELQTVVTAERPILECELPIDGSRFTAVIPPVVTAPAFAIRRRASQMLGGGREPVLITAILCAGVAVSALNLVAIGIGLGVWLVAAFFLRLMAKADPYMTKVYLRQLRYPAYLPARSRPLAKGLAPHATAEAISGSGERRGGPARLGGADRRRHRARQGRLAARRLVLSRPGHG